MQTTLIGQTTLTARPSATKKIVAFILSFIVVMVILSSLNSQETINTISNNSPANLPEYQRYAAPSAKEFGLFKATTTKDIVVRHISTKKVEKKNRYFFSVKNNEKTPVEKVYTTIELYTQKTNALINNRFSSDIIESGVASTVYLEARTSPDPVAMGGNNISSFKYAVYDGNGYLIATGGGEIPPEIIE